MNFFLFICSIFVIAFGQPVRSTILSILAAACGYALFFYSCNSLSSRKGVFWASTIGFSLIQLVQLSWMTSIEFQGFYIVGVYVALACLLGFQFGLLSLLIPLNNLLSLRQIVTIASVWTLMEYSRLLPLCGFSWNPVGLSLSCSIFSLQLASVIGILGLSFWVILTNLFCFNWLLSKKWNCAFLFLFCGSLPYLYGFFSLSNSKPASHEKQLQIALVQTALLPSQKIPYLQRLQDHIPPLSQWKKMMVDLRSQARKRWDLIVFPEAVVTHHADQPVYPLEDVRTLLINTYGEKIISSFPSLVFPYAAQKFVFSKLMWLVSNLFLSQVLANFYQSELIIGLDHYSKEKQTYFNSAFYIKGGEEKFFRYDKQILLPLAEYLPFSLLQPLVKRYGIHSFFSPGEGPQLFGKKIQYAPCICYEETFSEKMRELAQQGADLFVNLTNDNYYPNSSLHQQHFDHARLRAVENGIPLLRACNGGITGMIDCFGKIQAVFDQTTGSQGGVLALDLSLHKKKTLFSLFGEKGLVFLCGLICLGNLFQFVIDSAYQLKSKQRCR